MCSSVRRLDAADDCTESLLSSAGGWHIIGTVQDEVESRVKTSDNPLLQPSLMLWPMTPTHTAILLMRRRDCLAALRCVQTIALHLSNRDSCSASARSDSSWTYPVALLSPASDPLLSAISTPALGLPPEVMAKYQALSSVQRSGARAEMILCSNECMC